MGEIPPSPSSFKSALSFFNSLDRPSSSPLIPRKRTSNFEVNLKLVIDNKTVARKSYGRVEEETVQQQLIPRAKLSKSPLKIKQEEGFQRLEIISSSDESSNRLKFAPKVPPRPSVLKVKDNWGLAQKSATGTCQLTPDVEAKQIIEAFSKEIKPYNQFEVSEDALESDFFKQTLTLVSSKVNVSEVKYTKRSSRSSYGLPDNIERNEAFLEPYLQDINNRQSPQIGAPSPSPPLLRALAPPPAVSSSRSDSRESLISSNGGSDASSERSEEEGYGATCDISLMERLVLCHPIWFLPGIQRAGAFHLLQGKEDGSFVVRKSSQSDTMALSVRLPPDKGPYIEHYLIHSSEGRLGLETSENRFVDMAALIAHYASCCDELPVQLTLPKAIRESKSRQQLSSLALLGQEFWSYSPPPSAASSPDADLVLNLNPLMSTFKQAEPSTPVQSRPTRPNTLNLLSKNDPNKAELNRSLTSLKGDSSLGKNPPPPPPRWSKPTTPQNNFTVTTTVTFSVNAQSPSNEKQTPSQMEVVHCDPKRMSPEGQCNNSTISSRGSVRNRSISNLTSPNSILSPSSDSILSPDTLSPLSVAKGGRQSKRTKPKLSKHYQESDIVDSPTMLYYKSGLGDKISDYEDVWGTDGSLIKPKTNNNNGSSNLASPDILQHTPGNIVSLNNNVLSPADSSHNGSMQRSVCSTPVLINNPLKSSNLQSPVTETLSTPHQQTQDLPSPKQQSPFYAEPADSLTSLQQVVPKRLVSRPAPGIPPHHRHSNPPGLNSMKTLSPGLERVEDGGEFQGGLMSSSVDNLSPKQRFMVLRKPDAKPVLPPFIKPKSNGGDTWQVDNGWKFVTNEADINMESSDLDYDSDWPTIPNLLSSLDYTPDSSDDRATLHDLISNRYPDIRTNFDMNSDGERCRISAYDNVELDRRVPRAPPSEISELTEFSDPWAEPNQVITETDESYSETVTPNKMKCASINRSKSFRDRLDPLLSSARIEELKNGDQNAGPSKAVGSAIRNYALELAQDKTTTFAQNIDNFIACTCEAKETNPQIVMRNMRQFMSGMKNYLVKHGEKGFSREIERERSKLKSTEFLNLDAILEGVMHKLVVRPLKLHLQKLFFDFYTKTGAIRLLADNIQYAAERPIGELGIKSKVTLPSENVLNKISQYIQRLQQADSPLEKLENLLAAIAIIFNSVKTGQLTGSGRSIQLGADDFLPIFVWVMVKTNFVAAEIEAEYMWGLLHPSLFSGEGGYYLTTLSSAVHVLKNFKKGCEENNKNHVENDSVLKVVVPDELHGSILTKTVPARPHMTTKEVCKIIAHKARITNPQDYALYRLTDGEETILMDNECPQDFMKEGKHTMLAYKRIDAKIAWPTQDKLKI
ncbi:protein sprint [Euwallacea fornicatus]|uniref:protein sprint n=1 Tax=Euwallacea fornicatus TaxID=995702 RepID=UPI00338DE677